MAFSDQRISPGSPSNSVPPAETFPRQSLDSYQTGHSGASDASTASLHNPSGTYVQSTSEKLAIQESPPPRHWRFAVLESKPTWYRCLQLVIVLTILILDVTSIRSTIFTPTSNAFLLAVCCITCLNLLYRIFIDRLLAVRLNVGWAQRIKNMWIPPACEGLNCVLFLVGWIWIAIEVFGKGGRCEIGSGSRDNDRDGPTPEQDGENGDGDDDEDEDDDDNDANDGNDNDDDNTSNEPTATTQNVSTPGSTGTSTATVEPSTTLPAALTESPLGTPTSADQTNLPTPTLPPGTDDDDNDGTNTPPVVDDGTNTPPPADDGTTTPPVPDDDTNAPPPVDDGSDTESEDNANLNRRRKHKVKRRLDIGKRGSQAQPREDDSKDVVSSSSRVSSTSKVGESQMTVGELTLENVLLEEHQLQPKKAMVFEHPFSVPSHKEQEWNAHLVRRDQSVYPSSLDGIDCGVDSTILGLSILMWFSFAIGLVTVVRELRENLEVVKSRRRERQAEEGEEGEPYS